MYKYLILIFLFVFYSLSFGQSDEFKFVDKVLPDPGFEEGWKNDGFRFYNADTVFEYIDGEAEIYFPYGFESLATTTYMKNEDYTLVADVYKMGSLLDAFGIYSNYIYSDADIVDIGGQGFVDGYQMMFYKGDYFVRLSAYNEPEQNRRDFLNCAEAISKNITGESKIPIELDFLQIEELHSLTEQYIAESLLGYKFFSKGLLADATNEKSIVKIFVVIENSDEEADKCLNEYVEYLKENNGNPILTIDDDGTLLKAEDPLYKGVAALKLRNYILGVAKLKEPDNGINLIREMRKKVELVCKKNK